MSRRAARRIALALLLAAGLPLGGCAADPVAGYSTQTTFPTDVATIAVPIFQNDSYTRELEFELTDALVKEIQARTPYRLAPSSRADTVLLGRIRKVELDQLSKSRLTGLSEEVVVGMTIDFEWKDLRTDRVLVARREFVGSGLFVPSRPTGESIEIGQFNAVQQLAQDVVAEMRGGW
ncbi:MAG: LPS assembly lipoprotein LptE [Planctomycetota bacterium]